MSFRGRGNSTGFQRQLPFGLDYQDINKPQEAEKPTVLLPVNAPSTQIEQTIASHYINFQTTLKDGPFYTGDDLKTIKKMEISEDGINDGLKRYSDKYIKKRKIGPSIDDHPYKIEFFPQELYKAMGVDDNKKKLVALSQVKETTITEKLKQVDDHEDEKEEEKEVEEYDDEFEEDDDDDYNAEKYFDDGEDFGDEDDMNDEAAF